MICKHILSITFLNEPELNIFYTVKLFQVLLYNEPASISHLFAHS